MLSKFLISKFIKNSKDTNNKKVRDSLWLSRWHSWNYSKLNSFCYKTNYRNTIK